MIRFRWLLVLLTCALFSTGTSYKYFQHGEQHTRTGFLEQNIRNPVSNSAFVAHISPVTAGSPVPCCPHAANALEITITNLSRQTIAIDWSKTIFTTERGSRCGVAFKGGKLAPECFRLRSETVAPGKTLRKTLFPGLHASYHYGEERNTPFVGEVGVQLVVRVGDDEVTENMLIRVGAR